MKKIILIIVMLIFCYTSAAKATLVKPINIEVLTGLAQYIVKAEVVDKQTEMDEYESGKLVTYYTLKVVDWIKGKQKNSKIVIKQLADGEFENNNGVKFRQNLFFPKYELHKTYVFFLPTPHHMTGLLAPIGLWQGVFDVELDANGQDVLPQLKSPMRSKILAKGLKKNSNQKFLSLDLSNPAVQDTSYNTFKFMLNTILAK